MQNTFSGSGRLGKDPEVKKMEDDKFLCACWVRFPNNVKDKEGNWEDKGGFWANVNIWTDEKNAEHIKKNLTKGKPISVANAGIRFWYKEDNIAGVDIDARTVLLDVRSIESAVFKTKKSDDDGAGDE